MREKWVLLLVLFAAISVIWSTDPKETFAKSVALVGCTLFAVFLNLQYTPVQRLKRLGIAFLLMFIASVVAAIYFPQIGIMQGLHEGIWSGAFNHKNMLGRMTVLGTVVFFILWLQQARSHSAGLSGLWTIGLCLAVFLLIQSSSKSSVISLAVLSVVFSAYLFARMIRMQATTALLLTILMLCIFILQYQHKVPPPVLLSTAAQCWSDPNCEISSTLALAKQRAPISSQKDTATGRVKLWQVLYQKIERHPILGHGYGGFWRGFNGPSAPVWKQFGWLPPHGHNGLIDIGLDLGAIGVLLFLAGVLATLSALLAQARQGNFGLTALFQLAMLGAIALLNIGESDLLASNSLLWILYSCVLLDVRGKPAAQGSERIDG